MLRVDPAGHWQGALSLARALREGRPAIWLMEHAVAQECLLLELVPLSDGEMQVVIDRLVELDTK